MHKLELYISKKDWFLILNIATLFGAVLGFIIKNSFVGSLFGAVTGIVIAIFAMIFISILNDKLLPKVNKKYWFALAFIFSFLSGFLGSLIGFLFFSSKFDFLFFTAVGILTYLIGIILYMFVVMKNRKENLNKLLIESRLNSLEAQLNPHFLFNSLNIISELIYVDQKLAEKSVLNLAQFLRKGMKEDTVIPVSEELSVVKNYIWLQNIRFNEKIEVTENIDFSLNSFKIPKFSIQLLVENSVKHSKNLQKNGLKIEISIMKYNDKVKITVSNNSELIQNLKFGIGLNNLKSRIEIINNGRIDWNYDSINKRIIFEILLEKVVKNANINN